MRSILNFDLPVLLCYWVTLQAFLCKTLPHPVVEITFRVIAEPK